MNKPKLSKKQLEKNLYITELKIKKIINGSNFFRRNLLKVIGVGLLFSIWAPSYVGEFKEKSIMDRGDYSYFELVLFALIIYSTFCVLAHFSWKYNDKKALQKLKKKKSDIKQQLDWYGIVKDSKES